MIFNIFVIILYSFTFAFNCDMILAHVLCHIDISTIQDTIVSPAFRYVQICDWRIIK